MKIALIYPARQMGYWPSLGLAYVAAMLEQHGHIVRIIDRNPILMQGGDLDTFTENCLDEFKPDIVGITATTPLMDDVINVLRILREKLPDIPLVMGGPHVTALPEETLQHYPEIDIVVRGEGEVTMPEIAEGRPLEEILGITWRDNGKIRSNPPRPLISDLDALPFPARHLFDMEFYLHPDNTVIRGLEGIRATHIYNARGCYHKCKFCAGSAVFGRRVRSNSPQTIVAEIQHLIDDYKVEGLYFDEDVFFSTRRRAEAICTALVKAEIPDKLKWAGLMRADAAPLDVLKMMKNAGCVQIEYGFETGSSRMLKVIRKGTTLQQNYEAARNTHKAGLRLLASMVVGCPSETESEFDETIEFLRDTEPHFVGLNKFVPLPGSQFFNELSEEGKLNNDDWGVFHVSGSVPGQEQISYSAMEGLAFYNKFCENEHGFIQDLNLAGIIISLLETLEEKRNGFDFSSLKLELFPIELPEKKIEETEFYWEKALKAIEDEELFTPKDILSKANLSSATRLAFLNNLGIYLMKDFRLRPAAACLDLARKEMEHPLLSANMGILFFRRKEFLRADKYFTSALSGAEKYRKRISWNFANTFLLRGRLDAAREKYEMFDKDFASPDGLMGLAACHVLLGNFDRAFTCWEKAFKDGNPASASQNMEASQALKANGGRVIGFKSIADLSVLNR